MVRIMLLIYIMVIINIMILVYIQLDFKPADIKHSSLRTMAKHVRRAMLPGNHEVFKISFAEGTGFCRDICHFYLHDADTVQQSWIFDVYWTVTDPIDAMKRSVAKLQYKGKVYTTFKPGRSISIPNVRAFDEANTGMVFQGSYLLDTGSSPLLAFIYAPSPETDYLFY